MPENNSANSSGSGTDRSVLVAAGTKIVRSWRVSKYIDSGIVQSPEESALNLANELLKRLIISRTYVCSAAWFCGELLKPGGGFDVMIS